LLERDEVRLKRYGGCLLRLSLLRGGPIEDAVRVSFCCASHDGGSLIRILQT
jgi:hypothetical protein